MWALENPARHDRLPSLVEETFNAVRIIRLTRDEDIKIIREANQTPVKHPVCGALTLWSKERIARSAVRFKTR